MCILYARLLFLGTFYQSNLSMHQLVFGLGKLVLLVVLWVGFVANGQAQNVIKGKISDKQTGETLIGASVVIEGTTEGTITDIDGNFQISTERSLPIKLVISFLGYEKITYEVTNWDQKVNVKVSPDNVMLDAVEVVGSRISEREKQAPLTVESMDVIAIREAPSGSFYESLGNMKGVDMTSASLGFKVINTRGFNSTSPVRSLQLIDGVDNQSPGLNFSLGNFLGSSDLDVMKVDIIAGASSAFYGPGAFNGVVNMTTKDPFTFPGLSASLKVGERDMKEAAIRWAQVFKNKEGKDKFGYKLNVYYFDALDWEAENYNPVDDSDDRASNPGGFDAVNVYGDESTETNNDESGSIGSITYPGLGRYYRTGYREVDLADYNTNNLKLNAAFHYKIKQDVEAIFSTSYSQGTTVYQGDNRYSLKNIQFYQNRLELRKKDKWFIRAYATHEDAGDSYDIVTTALRMQDAVNSEQQWNSDYKRNWASRYNGRVTSLPGYRAPDLQNETLEEWHEDFYTPWIAQQQDSLTLWHQQNRELTDTEFASNPRYEENTAAFDSAFDAITSAKITDNGSRFFDKSALYHVQGEYKFQPKWAEITVGGNARWYLPNTEGTIFSDTLEYTRVRTDSGLIITDSSYREITNFQYGVYVGAQKKFLAERLITTATIRMDKNENFDYLFSPAISFVYSHNEEHTFRATFTSAIRNPTLADQYFNYDVGRAILLGNLDGYDSLITTESFNDYRNTLNTDTLVFFNVDPIKPEEVKTIEFGYRGILLEKLYVDASYYHSWYTNFIGFQVGVDATFDSFGFPSAIQGYRLATNSKETVVTQGFSIGGNYYIKNRYALNANYSWNKLITDVDDPIIPAFNTPEHKYNIGLTGREIYIKGISLGHFGFGVNYKWIDGFTFEGSPQFTGFIDSYDLVDAQVNFTVPKIHTTFKVGASNLLDNRVYQVYGGPQVGRLAYFSVLFDWRNN
jgi:outer membrane receptor protein involved in Fe transport